MRVNSLSLKKVTSLPGVAVNKGCGKASGDSRLRLNLGIPRQPETILDMVTLRNLIRLAGTSLSYWSPQIYDHVVKWLESCVQGSDQDNTNTALQKEVFIAQEPTSRRLKSRKNLRTTGFNLCFNKGKRSVHSTSCMKEGTQVDTPLSLPRRTSSEKIHSINLDEWVMATELKREVEKCKNKDGRYGNLIQIIGSLSTIKLAYLMVKNNRGISAKGVDDSSLDGISLRTLQAMSNDTLSGRIKFSPVRRVYIKKEGKTDLRPLGISSPRQKIVQKSIEMVLTSIFEEIFLDCSHGSRIGRSCHTALKNLQLKVGNVSTYSWVVEGDIKGCFDNIPHSQIMKRIKQKVDCLPTINLVKKILDAGYILDEDLKKFGRKNAQVFKPDVGTPQGIILSPLFSNIVLHELDKFIEVILKEEFSKGKKRKANLEYRKLRYQIKKEDNLKKRRKLIEDCKSVPSKSIEDPDFKRLFYVRFVDDWVILVSGSLSDSRLIRDRVSRKLRELGLELNMEKTKITSLREGKCRFLGIDFFIRKNTNQHYKPVSLVKKNTNISIRQRFTPRLIFEAPILEVLTKLQNKGFLKRSSKGDFFPIGKSNCIPLTHPQILNYFNSRIRGILNYFSCVHNRNELWSIVRFLNYSCALTLARKFKLKSLAKTFKRFGKNLEFVNDRGKRYHIYRPDNLRMLPLNRRFKASQFVDIDQLLNTSWTSSMTLSQFDESCAICGTHDNIEIHHIKSIKKVRVKTRTYAQWTGGFIRKSIPLCRYHHKNLHAGTLSADEALKVSSYRGRKLMKANLIRSH